MLQAVTLRWLGALFLAHLLIIPVSHATTGPLRIASIFAASGPAAKANLPSIEAVRAAVNRVNGRGGINGRQIELMDFDNRSTPIGSRNAAVAAAAARVSAIIGCAWSSHSIAVAKVAQARQIPMISTISTLPELTRVGDYIFRVCYNDLLQGQAMARFARDHLHLRRAAILVDVSSPYSIGLARTFGDVFTALGGRIVAKSNYKLRQASYAGPVRQINAIAPDVLFIPGHDESAVIIRDALSIGMEAVFLGGDGWDAVSFFQRIGNRLSDSYFSTHWSADSMRPASRQFIADYKPDQMKLADEALAFDAVMLLMAAIAKADSDSPRAIRNALATTRSFKGITGTITFDKNGDPVKPVVIMAIQHGRAEYRKSIVIESLAEKK